MIGINKKNGLLFKTIAGSWPIYLIVLIVFSAGLLFGSISASKMDNQKSVILSQYVGDFIKKAEGINYQSDKMAREAIKNNIIMVASIYVLGLTVIGLPVVLAILFVRGFVIGFAVSFLSRNMSGGGLLFTAAAILPHNLLYIPAICFGSASSIMFTALLWKRGFSSDIAIWPRLVSYTGVMAVVLVLALGAGYVEGYVTPYFTKMAAGLLT